MRPDKKFQRGMTLVEALLSVMVLTFGFLGIAGLLANISVVNRKSAFHNYSLDLFALLQAQIQNAYCDLTPTRSMVDPGLVQTDTWISISVMGSAITSVGLLDASSGTTAPVFALYMTHSMNAAQDPSIAGNCGLGNPCTRPDEYRMTISICDLSDPANHPCSNPPIDNYWTRMFTVTKSCNIRGEDGGRGEFYN